MIPTREQFIELNIALNRSAEYLTKRLCYPVSYIERATDEAYTKGAVEARAAVEARLGYPITLRADLTSVHTEEELQSFIKADVDSYLEQSEACQQLPAWRWLHSQQNFIKAKNRIFKHWPAEERVGNGLEKLIAKHTIDRYERKIQRRDELLSRVAAGDAQLGEEQRDTRETIEIFQSVLKFLAGRIVNYRKWVAGVALALSNYHYGKTAEMAGDRKARVGSLITAWENLNEQLTLAQADTEIGEYLNPSILRVRDNGKLMALRALHQKGTLYFIGRADETVSERLFIRELVILHRKLWLMGRHSSAIADLFYLDGMKSAPTERAIQRIAKSALANWYEKGKMETAVRQLQRQ